MSEPHQLTELQLAILRVLWDRGRASAADVTEALRPDRALSQSTIATVLSRLERRGVVGHETVSRQYLFFSRVTESEVRHSMVRELTEQLFEGDLTALVSHLLTERDMSPGDLERVKALIEAVGSEEEGGSDGHPA